MIEFARRIRLAKGVTLYREYNMWMLDVIVGTKRIRESLHTHFFIEAIIRMKERLKVEWPAFAEASDEAQGVMVGDLINRGAIQQYYPHAQEIGDAVALRLEEKKKPSKRISAADALEEFLSERKGEGGLPHLANLRNKIESFIEFCEVTFIDEITRSHFDAYRKHVIADPKNGSSSVHQKLRMPKQWMTWSLDKEYLTTSPAAKFKVGKAPKRKSIIVYSRKELRAVLSAARRRGARWAAIVSLGLFAGLRRAEIIKRLYWEDIDLVRRRIQVRNLLKETTKVDDDWIIPIFDELAATIRKLDRQKTGRLFPVKDLRDISRAISEIFADAKVTRHRDGLQNLRHTFATLALEHRISASRVRSWLGHSQGLETMERHYLGRWRGSIFPFHWRGKLLSPTNMPQI